MRLKATLVVVGSILIGLALFFGWRGLDFLMFTGNPYFTIREVKISTQLAVSEQKIRDLTGIAEGKNIFSFSSSDKRNALLRNVPNLSEVTISKTLPNRVEITAIDRIPVIKIGTTNFASDKDGNIMVIDESQRTRWSSLPVLINGNERIHAVPGQKLSDKFLTALYVMNIYNEMDGISFHIEQIDVSGRIYLILQTAENSREVRLVWEEISSQDNIRLALKMASESLAQPNAASLIRLDVILTKKSVYGI